MQLYDYGLHKDGSLDRCVAWVAPPTPPCVVQRSWLAVSVTTPTAPKEVSRCGSAERSKRLFPNCSLSTMGTDHICSRVAIVPCTCQRQPSGVFTDPHKKQITWALSTTRAAPSFRLRMYCKIYIDKGATVMHHVRMRYTVSSERG